MNFFQNIEQTQLLRGAGQALEAFVPLHRRLFPLDSRQRALARAAVREVLG